jgi:NADPH:quinone reductase-like Zn-dependent oxidoreductase
MPEHAMKAAVVSSFGAAPRYEDFPAPVPTGPGETVVDVIAAGLHPRVRSQADGSHYTSTGELPLVPGIDGVGRDADGALRYFVLPDTPRGSMAERTVIDPRRSILLPGTVDPVAVAAAMNPAMSSWIALRRRAPLTPGQNVLVLGATGNAGRMAVQVARFLGAGQVIAAGRDAGRLAGCVALGATSIVPLPSNGAAEPLGEVGGLGELAGEIDVVLDYLWGAPAVAVMTALVTHRDDDERPLTWIEIGSVAGSAAAVPSAALRATRLQIIGSGQGSVSTRDIVAELPALAAEITNGSFQVDARPLPLAEVQRAWADAPNTSRRIVLTPRP